MKIPPPERHLFIGVIDTWFNMVIPGMHLHGDGLANAVRAIGHRPVQGEVIKKNNVSGLRLEDCCIFDWIVLQQLGYFF